MPPTKIFLLRHAEKPNGLGPPFGVAEDGTQSADELTVRGWQRAGALVQLFAAGTDPRYPRPDVIFAAGPRPGHKSVRPPSTIRPLAERLGLTPRTEFTKGDEAALVQAVLGLDGVVLISWQHEMIPVIATQLLGDAARCPQHWPGKRYDVTWVLRPRPEGGWVLEQVPQKLLRGDAEDVIA